MYPSIENMVSPRDRALVTKALSGEKGKPFDPNRWLEMFFQGTGDLRTAQRFIRNLETKTGFGGCEYIPGFVDCRVDCMEYAPEGIRLVPGGRYIPYPDSDEAIILVTALSICGTDRGQLKMAREGKLEDRNGIVFGHEMGGLVVAKGIDIPWFECQIGDFVNPESHAPCGFSHNMLDSCVYGMSGCDSIYSIRGSLDWFKRRLQIMDFQSFSSSKKKIN